MSAPLHPREEERLARLRSYDILDTERDARFDRFVFMAAQIAKAPVAGINFLDVDRAWTKAGVGISVREVPREHAFCPFAIMSPGIMVVEDALLDPRFARNPHVLGPPHIRFYAGVALASHDGLPVGDLCVLGPQPRVLSKDQQRSLVALAREIEELLHTMANR